MVMRHSPRRHRPEKRKSPVKWLVEYGGLKIECRDEADARRLVGSLHRKGYRVAAQTIPGAFPARQIQADQVKNWLSE